MYFPKTVRITFLGLAAALLASCGGGGGGGTTPPVAPTVLADNAVRVTVDGGPTGSAYIANRLFTDVTVCNPASPGTCVTLDHVLVDTGSTGLRVINSPEIAGLNLPKVTNGSNLPLLNCAQFLDGSFMWGGVATANVQLGSKTALNIPIQIAADSANATTAFNCPGGTQITSAIGAGASALGAKGILGIGNHKEDCGTTCTSVAPSGFYFACTTSSCTSVVASTAPLAKQVKNPVPLFATDNNGLVVVLPAVSGSSTSTLTGSIVFGIGTRDNNQASAATLLQAPGGRISTSVNAGTAMANSFLDTGSNGLFFENTNLRATPCRSATGFYCPSATTLFSASLRGSNGIAKTLSFSVDNADTLFQFGLHVFPGLAGPSGDSTSFDWGLPFFFGKSVFIGIDDAAATVGAQPAVGPFYAF